MNQLKNTERESACISKKKQAKKHNNGQYYTIRTQEVTNRSSYSFKKKWFDIYF